MIRPNDESLNKDFYVRFVYYEQMNKGHKTANIYYGDLFQDS